jgi:hypothetical protein
MTEWNLNLRGTDDPSASNKGKGKSSLWAGIEKEEK